MDDAEVAKSEAETEREECEDVRCLNMFLIESLIQCGC